MSALPPGPELPAAVQTVAARHIRGPAGSRSGLLLSRMRSIAEEVFAAARPAGDRLAAEPERIGPFLAATGLDPSNLRAAAAEPGFLAAVLEHIGSSDSLLLEFAENLRLNPELVGEACRLLAGQAPGPGDFA